MNFWISALSKAWATQAMVKKAYEYKDCSKDDLRAGVEQEMVQKDQYKYITGENYN
ncbi:XkdX family protein [Terribacillus saccharophilus]